MPKLARSELWSHGPETQEDYKSQMLAGSDYELDRDLLGDPAVVIRPDVGDLVLFDARKPHAVKRNKKGRRVTASCFVGYYGADKPLSTFSWRAHPNPESQHICTAALGRLAITTAPRQQSVKKIQEIS